MNERTRTIEFGVVSRGQIVRINVSGQTVANCFGLGGSPHALLMAYEANRSQIDAAVMHRAAEGASAS